MALELVDWITPHALVLSLVGELTPAEGILALSRLEQWITRFPGVRLVVDLADTRVGKPEILADFLLSVAVLGGTSGSIAVARPSRAGREVLARLNMDYLAQLPLAASRSVLEGATA